MTPLLLHLHERLMVAVDLEHVGFEAGELRFHFLKIVFLEMALLDKYTLNFRSIML